MLVFATISQELWLSTLRGNMQKITKSDHQKTVPVESGKKFIIELRGNPTTGYEWSLDTLVGGSVKPTAGAPEFVQENNSPDNFGGGGIFTFPFEALKPGITTITLRNAPSFAPDQDPEFFIVIIEVK